MNLLADGPTEDEDARAERSKVAARAAPLEAMVVGEVVGVAQVDGSDDRELHSFVGTWHAPTAFLKPTMSIESESREQQPEELFDSLPYYDNDLDVQPILRQKVEAELAKESRKNPNPNTLHPKVPPPLELFQVCISFVRF